MWWHKHAPRTICMSLKVKGEMLIKTMCSDVSVASDGAGHRGEWPEFFQGGCRHYSGREFVPVSGCPWEEGIGVGWVVDPLLKKNLLSPWCGCQDQDQDSLLVKRRNDNHSPGPVIRELVPSSHQRSELSNTILSLRYLLAGMSIRLWWACWACRVFVELQVAPS